MIRAWLAMRRYHGTVLVPEDCWNRVVEKLSEARGAGPDDVNRFRHDCAELYSDLMAMRVGEVRL